MADKTSAAARSADPNEENLQIDSLPEARRSVQACRRCDLYANATQAVFGEGPAHARILFVGEQPGDQEDLAGKPFVGPAGRLFDQCLEEVGIDRADVYVTNAVKHFKFEPRGKRRLHRRPDAGEIAACRFWLDLETEFLESAVIVALGATAARSVLGKAVTISKVRGTAIERGNAPPAFVTIHPSYILRIPDRADAPRTRGVRSRSRSCPRPCSRTLISGAARRLTRGTRKPNKSRRSTAPTAPAAEPLGAE